MNSLAGFKQWLIESEKSTSTVNSVVSRIRRLLDEYSIKYEFEKDGCKSLLEELTYTAADARNGIIPKASIKIRGDYIIGLNSLKRALKLYVDYLNLFYSNTQSHTTNLSSCIFTGSFRQFNKYTGPMWRNKVQMITKTLKRSIVLCEHCGQKKELHAAHKHGFDRLDIIKKILTENFQIGPDLYSVDLTEFERIFMEYHKYPRDIFYFLCQDCHKKYDNE